MSKGTLHEISMNKSYIVYLTFTDTIFSLWSKSEIIFKIYNNMFSFIVLNFNKLSIKNKKINVQNIDKNMKFISFCTQN